MPDIPDIKAKVVIEYDGSGIEEAKKDLASLAEMADSFGEGAGSAGDGLAALDEQASKSAEHMQVLTSAMEGVQKPLDEGARSVAEMTGALQEHRDAVDETGQAYEEAQKPAEEMVSTLSEAAPRMQEVAKQAQGMQQALAPENMSAFQDMASTIGGSIEDIQNVVKAATPTFRDAFSIPADMVLQFDKNGSLIGDSVKYFEDATSTMAQGAQDATQPLATLQEQMNSAGKVASASPISNLVSPQSAQNIGQLNAALTNTGDIVDMNAAKIGNFGSMTADANKAVQSGLASSVMYGAEGDVLKPIGMGEAFGGAANAVMDGMDRLMMPLMAAQMIGMAVGAVSTGIYNMAAVAEGPGAHSLGTFTGSVDALGQTAQKSAEQFSESFGRQVMPTLDAMNYQMNQGNGSGGAGGLGASLGAAGSFLFNLARMGSGIDLIGGAEGMVNQGASLFGMAEPFQGPGPVSPQLVQAQQIQAQLAQSTAVMQAQANDPSYLAAQAYLGSQQHDAQVAQASYTMSHYSGTTGPTDPMNNIIQAELIRSGGGSYGGTPDPNQAFFNSLPGTSQGGPPSAGPESFLDSLFGGGSGPRSSAMNGMFPGFDSGVGDFFGGIGDFFNKMFSGGPGTGGPSPFYDNSSPFSNGANNAPYEGCFPAGTRVRMSDGTEKAIETLQIGDAVLGSDGAKQVSTSIRALILPPPKRVYTLTFSDGNTLTLTDAHPISTTHGWKSIEPKSTAKENPSLEVSRLMWGDVIHTANGTVQLAEITPCKGKVQVYNITVGNPHTFYANGVLVHNKLQSQIGQQAADQIGGIQLPHIDLSGMASTLGGDFSSIQLPHLDLSGMASGVGSAFSGISLPHLDLSGMASGIGSAFSGISLPHIDLSSISSSLSGAFSGISIPSIPNIGAQISSQLGSMFSGISLPSIPDIGAQISGALSGMFGGISIPSIPNLGGMISGAMSGMFGGISLPSIPDLGGMLSGAMSGMFGGISLPSIPNLGGMLTGAMSGMFGGISLPSIPFFASGVQGFAGGAAVVGEAGMEVAEYNGQYALFDQGAAFVNLPAGSSVYPIQDMASYNSPRMLAQGTGGGGGFSPISLGGGGGSMPQSINLSVHLDSQAILSAIGLPLSQNIRLASGQRGF